jgi:hypothetical protein
MLNSPQWLTDIFLASTCLYSRDCDLPNLQVLQIPPLHFGHVPMTVTCNWFDSTSFELILILTNTHFHQARILDDQDITSQSNKINRINYIPKIHFPITLLFLDFVDDVASLVGPVQGMCTQNSHVWRTNRFTTCCHCDCLLVIYVFSISLRLVTRSPWFRSTKVFPQWTTLPHHLNIPSTLRDLNGWFINKLRLVGSTHWYSKVCLSFLVLSLNSRSLMSSKLGFDYYFATCVLLVLLHCYCDDAVNIPQPARLLAVYP